MYETAVFMPMQIKYKWKIGNLLFEIINLIL